MPTGTNEPTFEMENTIPRFDSGTANGVLIVLTFSEALDPDSLPPGAAFFINTITTNVSVDNVSIAGAIVTLTVSPPILVDQTVEVSNNAYDGAGYVPLKDFAGNEGHTCRADRPLHDHEQHAIRTTNDPACRTRRRTSEVSLEKSSRHSRIHRPRIPSRCRLLSTIGHRMDPNHQ